MEGAAIATDEEVTKYRLPPNLRTAYSWSMIRHTRTLGIAGAALLLAAIALEASTNGYASSFADLIATGWGRTITLDLYIGLAFIAVWIWRRETNNRTRIGWILSLLVLGNIATGVYVAFRAASSANMTEFLTGSPTS